jgi:hypothetical protein
MMKNLKKGYNVTVLQYANELTNMMSSAAGTTVAGLAVYAQNNHHSPHCFLYRRSGE